MTNKDKAALEVYKRTINDIDDFFEYRHESETDKLFIREQLELLTSQLQQIYSTKLRK